MLRLYILNKRKLEPNSYQILIDSSLVIIQTALSRLQLKYILNKVINLVLIYRLSTILSQQSISYILYVRLREQYSTQVLFKYTLYNRLLFQLSKALCIQLVVTLRACSSALVLERRLENLVDCCSASYTLNLLRYDIRDSNIYIFFSIGLLYVVLLRHNALLLRRHFSRVKQPAQLDSRLSYKLRQYYININILYNVYNKQVARISRQLAFAKTLLKLYLPRDTLI